MPKSKLRRIAALSALVLAIVTLALVGGANAFAATGKPVTGTKGAVGKTGKAGKVGKLVRLGSEVRNEGDEDGAREPNGGEPPNEPPVDFHFGW